MCTGRLLLYQQNFKGTALSESRHPNQDETQRRQAKFYGTVRYMIMIVRLRPVFPSQDDDDMILVVSRYIVKNFIIPTTIKNLWQRNLHFSKFLRIRKMKNKNSGKCRAILQKLVLCFAIIFEIITLFQ